jgi:hypothetical protein
MSRCPSELDLELHLLAPARSRLAPHLAECARCRGQLAAMEAVGDKFRREVFPATVDAVVERSGRRRLPRWLVAAPLGALAAAAAALFLFVRPPADYVGAKGALLGLTVLVNDAAGPRAARDGEAVSAAASLRFEVRPARACGLWLVSVDGGGQVSRLYPPAGGAAEVAAAATLPGGAVLDGQAGPERVFAVCAPSPLPWAEVERAARTVAAGGAAAVRAAGALGGLPRDAAQATVLLEKRP